MIQHLSAGLAAAVLMSGFAAAQTNPSAPPMRPGTIVTPAMPPAPVVSPFAPPDAGSSTTNHGCFKSQRRSPRGDDSQSSG